MTFEEIIDFAEEKILSSEEFYPKIHRYLEHVFDGRHGFSPYMIADFGRQLTEENIEKVKENRVNVKNLLNPDQVFVWDKDFLVISEKPEPEFIPFTASITIEDNKYDMFVVDVSREDAIKQLQEEFNPDIIHIDEVDEKGFARVTAEEILKPTT